MARFCTLLFLVTLFSLSLEAMDLADPYIEKYWPPKEAQTLKEHLKAQSYKGADDTNNIYAEFTFPENNIANPLLLITGVEDPIPFWFDTVLLAQKKGFRHVYIIELRGQGHSQRVPGNNIKAIHLNNFENYDADFISAMSDINNHTPFEKPVYMISHSTGSLVVTSALEKLSQQMPSLKIEAMSFWSPLIAMKMSPWLNNGIVRPLLYAVDFIYGKCCGLLIGKKYQEVSFKENHLTTDPEKHELVQTLKYDEDMGSSGVSLKFGLEALEATRKLREEKIKALSIPTLLIQSELDEVVVNDISLNNDNIKVVTQKGAKHALNMETPEILNSVFNQTMDFFGFNP